MQTGRDNLTFLQRLRLRETAPVWSLQTAFFFVVAYVAIWILSVTIIATLRSEIDGQISAESYLLILGMSSVVTLVSVVVWARRRLGDDWLTAFKIMTVRGGSFVLTLLFGLGVAWALDLLGGLVGAKSLLAIPAVNNGLLETVSVIWVIGAVSVLLIQPIAETLIFSGLLYPATTERTGNNITAIVGTGFVYMLVNVFLSVQQDQWFVVLQPLLMMLFIIGVRAYTKSTLLAVVARIGFGLFIILVAIIRPAIG
jgi:membrane protease YdiL (CAAX protease family)